MPEFSNTRLRIPLEGFPVDGSLGTLVVTTQPAGAEIFINGKKEGLSPVTKQLMPGRYKVLALLEGFGQAEKEVRVVGEKQTEVKISLYPMNPYKKWGHVTFWLGSALGGLGAISLVTASSGSNSDFVKAVSVTSIIAGGVLVTTGIVLWSLSPGDKEWAESHTALALPTSDGRGLVFSISGRW